MGTMIKHSHRRSRGSINRVQSNLSGMTTAQYNYGIRKKDRKSCASQVECHKVNQPRTRQLNGMTTRHSNYVTKAETTHAPSSRTRPPGRWTDRPSPAAAPVCMCAFLSVSFSLALSLSLTNNRRKQTLRMGGRGGISVTVWMVMCLSRIRPMNMSNRNSVSVGPPIASG